MKIVPLLVLLFPTVISLAGCSRDPSLEISGSFFPAWMLSILIGIFATAIARRIFVAFGIDPFLKPLLLIYGCLALSFMLATWLLLYS